MATEIRVPTLGESVSEATVGTWFKKVGDAIKADEPLLELETDKVTIEVPAAAAPAAAAEKKAEPAAAAPAAPAAAAAPAASSMPPAPSAGKLLAENNLS